MVAAESAVKFIPGNSQHIGARDEQQDSFGFSDPYDTEFVAHAGLLAVVADGMGGMAQGKVASKSAVDSFLKAYMSKTPGESIPAALSRALDQAASTVLSLGRENGLQGEIGTTLVAAAVRGQLLYWTSAGDSRLYLVRQGRATQLTVDHVYARELDQQVAKGLISRSYAAEHPE
ncbi:MAG: PP2C family protein-serine/threonine phosphatase, partial [Blastocatellia bacterium]